MYEVNQINSLNTIRLL